MFASSLTVVSCLICSPGSCLKSYSKINHRVYNSTQSWTTMHSLVQPCTTMYNHEQPFTNVYNLEQQCTNMYNHLQPFTSMYNYLQPCTTMFKHAQLCTTMYNFTLWGDEHSRGMNIEEGSTQWLVIIK